MCSCGEPVTLSQVAVSSIGLRIWSRKQRHRIATIVSDSSFLAPEFLEEEIVLKHCNNSDYH